MNDPLVSIVREGGKVLHASESAMLCAISHGQVTIDGFVVKVSDEKRWRRSQVKGRTIRVHQRVGVLCDG